MRRYRDSGSSRWVFWAALAFVLAANSARATDEAPTIVILPEARTLLERSALDAISQSQSASELIFEVGESHSIALEFQAGMPAGLRLKYFVGSGWAIEASYGGMISSVGSGDTIGIGARHDFTLASDHENDALVLSPGGNVYFMPGDPTDTSWFFRKPQGTVVFIAANADLMWVHDFSRHFGIELGVRAGIGLAVGGISSNGANAAGLVVPDVGVVIGARL